MSGSPASRGEESVSLPCSLPSTPIFPPLTEALSQVAAKSREDEKQLENRTGQLQDHAELEAQAEGNISTAIADGQQHQQREHPQAKKHRLVPPQVSESNAKGYNNDKPQQRRAQTLAFGPSGMPSSLLRPLDHEDEKKLLQLEQQFRKERMETLRRQNASRRRRHAEKLQHLRAATVREQAAALEDRHQKLQAARILMERGLAAAAASASADASAAANQFDTTSNTATHAPDHSSALSTTDIASALVATTAPAVRCQRREMPFNAAAPAAGDLGPVTTSDSLPICQATRHLAPPSAASKTNAQQRSAHQHCARGQVYTSGSEHFPSCWRRDVNFSHATISIPRNCVDGNIVAHAIDAGYRGFPDVSTVAECVVAGAALRYKGAQSSVGDYEAAGSCGYHCQAAQEILSLWPCGRRTLLNAAVDNGEGVVLLQNQKINRLVLAASVSSHRRTEQASCDPYSSAAPSCESTCLRRVNAECGSHPSHPALSTSKTHPAPRMGGNNRRLTRSSSALLRKPVRSPPESSGQSQANQKQSLGSHVTTRETEREQHRKQQQRKHLQRDQQQDAFRQQCQTTDDSPSRQQGRGLDLPQQHPPALKQQHQPNQSQAARTGCLTEYSDVDDGKICSFFKHTRQAAQSQILHVHSWYPQRSSPPTVLGVPLSVSPETQHDKHAHRRQNREDQPINSPDVRDCSPCESTASSATTGSAKHVIREQCPPAVQEQQVQVEQAPQQQSEGVDYHKNQRKNRPQLPRPGVVTRSSATARKNSYAGQFTVVSRAKVGEAQARRKSNQEAHKLDCDLSQRQPAATASTEALGSASPLGSNAAGASTFSFTSSSSTDKLLVPAALSDAATVSTSCCTHVALRPVVPVKVPSVFAERCINNAAEALQAHVPWGHTTVHKSRHNSTSRPVGVAVTTRAASSRRTSPWQQFQQGQQQQQQRYSHQLNQSEAHTAQDQHPERDKGSNHICTGVQVVNRKLKALIEQQLQYANPCASNVVAARDPVLRVAAVAGDVDSNSQDADINEEAWNVILKETHVEAADLASASLAANEMRASHSSRADGESMPLPQRISSLSNTVFSQSLSVDGESARQQLQHPKQFFGDHQSGQETTFPATEQFQDQAVSSQHQQHQPKSTEECVDCVRAVHGTEGREHSDTIGGSKRFELQGEDLPGGTVDEPGVDSFHRSHSKAEGGLVLSVNKRISCGQCVGKSVCTIEEQGEYMRSPVHVDGSVHPAEKTETDVRQYEAREASAMLPEGEDSPSTRTEPDVHSAQPPREYTSKKPDSHEGMQSEEERIETIPSSVYNDTCPRIIRVCAASALGGMNAPRKDKSTSSRFRHSEPSKKIHVRRRRLPQESRIACDLYAGLAGPTGCLRSSDSEDETEKEETGEDRAMKEEHSQSPENTCDATQETRLCVLPGKGISVLQKRIAEGECSRCSSTLFARSSGRLSSCSASCSSPTCRRTSTACDDAAATLTDKHCAGGSSVRSGRSARDGASQTTQPSIATECGNRGQAGCAAVVHDHFSVRCSLRNGPPHRAAGDSRRKCVDACTGKRRSSCGAAHNVTYVRRQRDAPCSSQVRPEQLQEQQKHESTASGFSAHSVNREQSELHVTEASQSPVYSLQEKQTADTSASPPSGHQQLCSERRHMNHARDQPQQFGPGAEMREVNDQRRLATNPASPTFRCSCCSGAGPRGQHRQEQPQYGNGNTAAEHETSQAKQRVMSCTKQATARRTKVPLTSCISGHSCKSHSGHATPCYSGSRHRTLATQNRKNCVSSDIPDAGIDPHWTNSRSSSGDRSSGNSSSRGREHMQRLDRCATTSGRQEGLNKTLSTAKKETYGGCGSPAPCMHVVSRSCNRPLRTVTSTSASLGNRESRRAMRCRSNQEPCWGAPEASRSNTCVSTCCGSAGDSVDSSTLCCTLSRRSSSKLRACEPPAQKCRTFRSLSTQRIKKATPKKRDSKDLKLQALADAEKKVEERLLLLDVNQKTLDEQHERRRYLQQQFLQQQQQQLQEQQLQQQQLLTLVQYPGLSREDELNPRTCFFGATKYAGADTTTQGTANGDLRQRRSASNQAPVEQAAGTGCRTHSTNVLRSDQGDIDSSARELGTLCALHPGIHQVFVPLNNATPALLPTPAPFAAFPSTPVTISLLPGPPPGTTPPTGLVRDRMLTPTLPSMTLQGNVSSKEKREKTLLAQVPRPSGKRPPYKSSKTATVFPPRPLERPEAAAIAVTATPAAVTATAVTGGPRETPDYIKLSRTSRGAVTKCLQPPPQVATTRALPPLRARSSRWTQWPQVLGLLRRDV